MKKPHLGVVYPLDPAEGRALFLRLLEETGGSPVAVARQLTMSVPHYHHLTRKYGLVGEAARIRKRLRSRFRLPRWEEVDVSTTSSSVADRD